MSCAFAPPSAHTSAEICGIEDAVVHPILRTHPARVMLQGDAPVRQR